MCGIYGAIGNYNSNRLTGEFSAILSHRGPDDYGIFIDNQNNIAIGHTRLSIIDTSINAHQPMSDKTKKYIIVFNGEIYNFQEIKNELISLGYAFNTSSDTEVVLNSYIEYGEHCVHHFRGMFAFCIYDKPKNELFLARDRFGIKPLIYTFLNEQFIFSSELRPFLQSNCISKHISHAAVNEYFRYGSVQQPNTILEGVTQLMPGHSMVVKSDLSHKITRYYDYVDESSKMLEMVSYQDAIIKVRDEFAIATRYHMVADVEVGAFLSGGVDSTAIVAMMKHCGAEKINTFSVGFVNKTHHEDETYIASKSANKLGCKHTNINIDDAYVKAIFDNFIDSIDQPSIDGINTYIVSREAAKEVKVALSGLGGDEIFAGYPHFKTIAQHSQKRKSFVSFVGNNLNGIRPNRFTNNYSYVGVAEDIAVNKHRMLHRDLNKVLKIQYSFINQQPLMNLSPIQKISKKEIDNYLLNTLLRDSDVLSMAHSLEVRPVFLDHKFVELAFSLQDSFKVRGDFLKSVFVDSVKDIIPEEVWRRKKTGFEMPVVDWMNGCLNHRFCELLKTKNADILFTKNFLDSLRSRIELKNAKPLDWSVFVFLAWLLHHNTELDITYGQD